MDRTKQSITLLTKLINSNDYKQQARKRDEDWTRNTKKLNIVNITLCILSYIKLSYIIALDTLSDLLNLQNPIAKSSFAEARQKLNPQAFQWLNDQYNKQIKIPRKIRRKYRGYDIYAIDGTYIHVGASKENTKYFGKKKNKKSEEYKDNGRVSALIVAIRCFATGQILAFDVFPCDVSEHRAAYDVVEKFMASNKLSKKTVLICDRYYIGFEFMNYLESKGLFYLIRCGSHPFKNERASVVRDGVAYLALTSNRTKNISVERKDELKALGSFPVRIAKYVTSSGEEECLMTNIPARSIGYAGLYELYGRRWCIETAFRTLKVDLGLGMISERKVETVLQTIYAAVLLLNVSCVLDCFMECELVTSSEHRVILNLKYIIHRLVIVLGDILVFHTKISLESFKVRCLSRYCYSDPGRSFTRRKRYL